MPLTVTTTLPVVAPLGTCTPTLVAAQLVTGATVPLKLTVLLPCVAPKFVPVSVTAVPTGPPVGLTLLSVGPGGVTVKLTPLLATPLTVTTTLPVVAPLGTCTPTLVAAQLVTDAAVPLMLTVLLPCVAPKFVPVSVTAVPTGPLAGATVVRVGVGTTVKLTPLLATALTVTTTLPVVAPLGTSTPTLVAAQLATDATVPLKLTVLLPCVAPKFVPVSVTAVPTGPLAGTTVVRVGVGTTV